MFRGAFYTWWKAYQVNFPTQPTAYHLDFPIKSYDRFSGDCTEYQQLREAPWISVRGDFLFTKTLETQRSIHTQQGGLFVV